MYVEKVIVAFGRLGRVALTLNVLFTHAVDRIWIQLNQLQQSLGAKAWLLITGMILELMKEIRDQILP